MAQLANSGVVCFGFPKSLSRASRLPQPLKVCPFFKKKIEVLTVNPPMARRRFTSIRFIFRTLNPTGCASSQEANPTVLWHAVRVRAVACVFHPIMMLPGWNRSTVVVEGLLHTQL